MLDVFVSSTEYRYQHLDQLRLYCVVDRNKGQSGMVMHACSLANGEAEAGGSLEPKNLRSAGCQWLIPVILAIWEAEVGRIEV
jgi:hypothetical protein